MPTPQGRDFRAQGVVLTDGHINISVLNFRQDQLDHGLDFTGLHHFGVYVEDLSTPASSKGRRTLSSTSPTNPWIGAGPVK